MFMYGVYRDHGLLLSEAHETEHLDVGKRFLGRSFRASSSGLQASSLGKLVCLCFGTLMDTEHWVICGWDCRVESARCQNQSLAGHGLCACGFQASS